MAGAIKAHRDAASGHDKLHGKHHREASQAHNREADRIHVAMEEKKKEDINGLSRDEAWRVHKGNPSLVTKYWLSAARLAKDLKEKHEKGCDDTT